MMKILVTGGSGFIGSTLIQKLNERGISVRALLRNPTPPNLAKLKYEAVSGDLLEEGSLSNAVKGIDGVIHVAGIVSAFHSKDYFDGNVRATKNLVNAIEKESENTNSKISKFVLVSSLAAGGPASLSKPRKESDPDRPVSLYGQSKQQGEIEVQKSTLPWVIIRPPMVFGPKDRGCYLFFKSAKFPVVPTFSNKEYSFIFSEDLCEGIIDSLLSPKVKETYYCAHPQVVSYSELMRGFAGALGKKPILLSVPEKAIIGAAHVCQKLSEWTQRPFPLNRDKINEIRPEAWTCEVEKIKKDLGFIAKHSLSEGAEITAKWYQQQGWL